MTNLSNALQSLLFKHKPWLAFVLSISMIGPSFAADLNEEKSGPTGSANYTVAQSTPIDKVIQTVYANSPLNVSVLRKVLVEANPKIISGNPQQRVKAGTTLLVPDNAQVVRHVLTSQTAGAADNIESGPTARDFPARRQWVRFP